MPGKVALAICPDLPTRLSRGMTIVMLTGTNGKTTTARIVEHLLRDSGREVLANRSGSNLRQGITAELAGNSDLFGRPKKSVAVIECDEAAFRTVCGELSPKCVVVTNLFRDQLDRFGEITHTLSSIRAGLEKAPSALLCVNADCPLCASLTDLPNPIRAFGMDAALDRAAAVSDAPRCLRCGGEYEYSYRTFAHLGGWRCPDCGDARPAVAVSVSRIDSLSPEESRAELTVDGETIPVTLSLPGAYNLYNAAAAVAAVTALGVPTESACPSLRAVESGFGRMERFELSGVPVTVILIKNPAGCDRALDYVSSVPGEKLLALCLNDNDADGRDVSWIWDADFERLLEKEQPGLLVSGTRAEDMRLRLKYAGAEEERVQLLHSTAEVIEAIKKSAVPVYVLPTYTAMLPLRRELSRLTGRKEFWK